MNEPIFKKAISSKTNTSRVLFSCHPNDFEKYFQDILKDISSITKCTIYYLEDQSYFPDDINDYYSYLKDVNLFVFPITESFINESSRAKEIDFRYALNNKAAILPILVEPNLYNLFNEKCASIQVLDKTTNDKTQEPYNIKLSHFLKSVLVDTETAEKIREAFDAYIFLSYRKKDRKYAQEIMSILNSNEFMRDIAIWYDEFLTPGEDFNEEIAKNLLKSKLMALVITPNINEKYGNKGNYVIEEEYPSAIKHNKPVLPIEALPTNHIDLKKNFKDIQDPINKNEKDYIANLLKNVFYSEGIKENDNPQHLYFVGLAYLNGIDTKKDVDYAIKILSKSLEKGFVEAGISLFRIYYLILFEYQKAIEYADKTIKAIGIRYIDYLDFLEEYYRMLYDNSFYDLALEVNNVIYGISDEKGKLKRRNLEALLYFKKGNNDRCVKIKREIYNFCKQKYGIDNKLTQEYGNSLLFICYGVKGHKDVISELEKDGFNILTTIYDDNDEGTKKPDYAQSLTSLLSEYDNFSKEGLINEELISLCSKIANAYLENNQNDKYIEYKTKSYRYSESLYGINDRRTDRQFKSIVAYYRDYYVKTKDESVFDIIIELSKHKYQQTKELLGDKNPSTVRSLETLIFNYDFCNMKEKSIESKKHLLNIIKEIYGPNNPKVIELEQSLKLSLEGNDGK